MPERPLPVVLDVDTGVDDALALLLAVRHPGLDLRAVTCVAGNVGVDQVVANTLRVLDAAGAGDVPVARGADRPLVEPAREARHVHGEDGLGDLGLPVARRRAADVHAVELLRRAVLQAPEPPTLVALAPLTNVALLLRSHPEVVQRVARVVVMGGAATGGNATACAEFNVRHDPEAAAVVLGAGLPVTLYGLDVFYDVALVAAEADALAASPVPAAALAGRLVQHQVARLGGAHGTLGDAGAVAAALDPGGLTTHRLPVRVELAGTWTRGQTVVDRRAPHDRAADPLGPPGPAVDVALGVDADRYRRHFLGAVTGEPSWAA